MVKDDVIKIIDGIPFYHYDYTAFLYKKLEAKDCLIKIKNDRIKDLMKRLYKRNKQLKEFKEEHKIMKQILIENGLWEKLLNDDRFLKYLRSDDNG